VHLRAVKLRGFKSFPDPVEVRLERGVGVIVGPNRSGKSNVADAIRWAAGSLSPNELRAEKPDDVLFAGSPGHAPATRCGGCSCGLLLLCRRHARIVDSQVGSDHAGPTVLELDERLDVLNVASCV